MSKKAFHIYNMIILLLLLSLNTLALFGAGMSEGGIGSEMWFTTWVSFASWVFLYIIQFIRPYKAWRISWFLIMVIFLYFWETGLGIQVGLMIIEQ